MGYMVVVMTEKERYDWDLNGIWDYNDESDEYIESYEDITKLLNMKEEEIKELKKENQNLKQMMENFVNKDAYWEKKAKQEIEQLKIQNQRQYNRLKELTELMYERQWEKLENIVEEWEKADELLQKEWHNYGDL